MRLAWFSPLPPMASGIADYSFELLPLIAQRAEVSVVCPPIEARFGRLEQRVRPSRRLQVPQGVDVMSPETFQRERDRDRFDLVFYHLGNNPFHEFVHDAAMERPGIAVFHDFVLHHLVDHITADGLRDPARYERLLREQYGEAGMRVSSLRFRGIHTDFEKFLFPLNGHIARRARAIVAHSREVGERLREVAPEAPITVIPHYAQSPPASVAGVTREQARAKLNLPAGAFLVGHFGFVTRPKQPAAVLGGFARLVEQRPDAQLLLVGADHTGGAVQLLTEQYALEGKVRPAGFVDLERFYLYLRAVDAVINLRYPSAGESSGTVARSLAEGRPIIVNNVGSFAEIPSDVALKVEVDGDQTAQVAGHLLRLAEDTGFRTVLAARARTYAATVLDVRRCRDLYLEVAESVAGAPRSPGRGSWRGYAASTSRVSLRPDEVPLVDLPEIRGATNPKDSAQAMSVRERDLPFIEWVAGQTVPPSGGAVAIDLVYRLLLRRPVEEPALRSAQLSLAAGEASRADLIRWIVQSREFREIELVEKTLNRVRLEPGPFTIADGETYVDSANTTERVVEIPWVLSRWKGEERVLDLGYAYAAGYYLTALLGLPIDDVHAVDWSAAPVPGLLRTRADLRALPYRDESFPLVLCISTIEHIGLDNRRYGMEGRGGTSGDAFTIAELERILQPGGRLLITVPFGRRMDESWYVQYDTERWRDLIGTTALRIEEQEIFHLTEEGWSKTEDLETVEQISYGVNAPAARSVLCASLVKPGPGA